MAPYLVQVVVLHMTVEQVQPLASWLLYTTIDPPMIEGQANLVRKMQTVQEATKPLPLTRHIGWIGPLITMPIESILVLDLPV